MTVAAVLAAACGGEPDTATGDPPVPEPGRSAGAAGAAGPVVEAVSVPARPPLDPSADPRTPLGELRAGYLPVWSPEADWAFPPEVCGSDWALDAVAEPTAASNLGVLGDVPAAAALSVMRYEHLVSRALAAPDMLGQLCVAVATVGAARTDALDLLAAHLHDGTRSAQPPGHPDDVTIVAASPTATLAVACLPSHRPDVPAGVGSATGERAGESVDVGGDVVGEAAAAGHNSGGVTGEGDVGGEAAPSATLRAYLLTVSRGLEDDVTDISFRVSGITDSPATDCGEMDSWAAEWEQYAADRAATGEIWATVGRTVTTAELCDSPPPGGPDECPRDWSQ
jgi:hypothetical protein